MTRSLINRGCAAPRTVFTKVSLLSLGQSLNIIKFKTMAINFCVVLTTVLTMVLADFYSSKYDNFDIQPLLENDRIMLSYTKCFLDQGPCTPDAKDFKKVIPEAVETTCGKCTPKQKQLIRKVINAIMERHPESWNQLLQKFDKDGKYKESFDKFLAENDK